MLLVFKVLNIGGKSNTHQ